MSLQHLEWYINCCGSDTDSLTILPVTVMDMQCIKKLLSTANRH